MLRPLLSRFLTGSWALTLLALVLFVAAWHQVLAGHLYLIGGDRLYCCLPWASSPAAHPAANLLSADPATQFLPWQQLVGEAFRHGRLPLWDPLAASGKALLANGQSAPLSPFTWLALPFPPAWGLSLAMLAKLWVAGLGMAAFLRRLGAGGTAAAAAGVAYAGSSYVSVWLGWPHSSVAAIFPWVFAAAEACLQKPSGLSLGALGALVGLQFLAGHAETSLHFGLGLGLYCLARWWLDGRRLPQLAVLVAGGLAGLLLAGLQLVPFLAELQRSGVVSDRLNGSLGPIGSVHLPAEALLSWLVPNAQGNPGIDGRLGWAPNYNEATAYAGVWALVLAPLGAWSWRRRVPGAVAGLLVMALFGAGIAYGPLTPLAARLPGLMLSVNLRATALPVFAVVALAGLGLHWLAERAPAAAGPLDRVAGIAAAGALAGVLLLAALFGVRGVRVEHLLPPRHLASTFWIDLAGLSLVAAALLAWLSARGRFGAWPRAAVCLLVLVEAGLFVIPYQPRVPPSEAPPPSAAAAWLAANAAGAYVAATKDVFPPEILSLYGVHDVRAYDALSRRVRIFWSHADPGFHDEALTTYLARPDPLWLAAAGVGYVVTPAGETLIGTSSVTEIEGVTIARVPSVRAFAYAASATAWAQGPEEAARMLSADPLARVVLEGTCCASARGGASVWVHSRAPQSVELAVIAAAPATVVVLQTYSPDWVARVDGRVRELRPADVQFQAVEVEAGSHLLTLSYEPAGVRTGAAASLTGLLVCVFALGWGLARR